jgi:hypothetical protein
MELSHEKILVLYLICGVDGGWIWATTAELSPLRRLTGLTVLHLFETGIFLRTHAPEVVGISVVLAVFTIERGAAVRYM